MTRGDIERLVQVTHSLRSRLSVKDDDGNINDREFDLFIDRMLWAIRASNDNPRFDEQRFRQACKGVDGLKVFPNDV